MIFKITKRPDLKISCINRDEIFSIEDRRIYKRNVYGFDNPVFLGVFNEEPTGMYSLNQFLVISSLDKIFSYKNFEVNCESFSCSIKVIKKFKDSLIILTCDNKINIFREGIMSPVYCEFKGTIVDLCVDEKSTFILDSEGLVYKTVTIIYSNFVILRKPMKIIPEPSGVPHSIYLCNNRLNDHNSGINRLNLRIYLCYSDGIEVYNIYDQILNLLYRYNTTYYKIIYSYCSNYLYCLDNTLNFLGDYPRVVLNCLVDTILENVCITKDFIYILKENEQEIKMKNTSFSFTNDKKIISLFTSLRSEFNIPSDATEEKILNLFNLEVLDKYRKFYLELITANETILEKKSILDKLEKNILEKTKKIENKRQKLIKRFEESINKYNELIKTVKINGKQINYYSNLLKGLLKEERPKLGFREELITQRNLLTRKIE